MARESFSARVYLFLFFLVGFIANLRTTEAFNIEARHYTSYRRETASMFGFSVAEYRDSSHRGWAIVGAPEAQTNQQGVDRGGAVYSCNVSKDDDCTQIEFDPNGHNHVAIPKNSNNYIQVDNKTLQWFGATVSTSPLDGGPILACAPRYVYFSLNKLKMGDLRDPVGTCWVRNPSQTSTEYAPCRTNFTIMNSGDKMEASKMDHEELSAFGNPIRLRGMMLRKHGNASQGSCQAGLGAAVSKGGDKVFIGAPGSWFWQGQLYSISRELENLPFVMSTDAFVLVYPGQIYAQLLNSSSKALATGESHPDYDDSYLGYSVTVGDFTGTGDNGTAVGMPRGENLLGKVVLYTSALTNIRNITGEQMGAYFGYAMAAGDIDGDQLDDLIIGAPMYTIPENPEMTFETGRIYIHYGKGPIKYQTVHTRDGETNRGRFGLSVASLGDINRDDYGDIAVGAPYAGPEGRGAVYIYLGSSEGISAKPSQVIYGHDLSDDVRTFGFSIAGSLDLDANDYPDMVVGSYESGTAMFFRSRPVINMLPNQTFLEFRSLNTLHRPSSISLEEKSCTLSDSTQVSCLSLKSCFGYWGHGIHSQYAFHVEYVLDVKKKNPRLFFLEHEGLSSLNETISADRGRQFCRNINVYISPSIRDKLTSLDAEVRMSLVAEHLKDDYPRDPTLALLPVLPKTSTTKDSISIRNNCGVDNVCTPNLQLSVESNVKKYLLGSRKRFELDVLIQNTGEDAFEATYNLNLPHGVNYIKIVRIDKAEIPVLCSPHLSDNNTLKCDIGNPLPANNLVHFNVLLQPVDVYNEKSSYEFAMSVNSSNPEIETTKNDNVKNISLEIWVETDLLLEGESKPRDLYYDPANYTTINVTTDVEYGPAFVHNYTIRNQGPSRIEEAEIYLIWPAETLAGDGLVYLLEQPETNVPLICATANANPLTLKIEQRRRFLYNSSRGYLSSDRSRNSQTNRERTGSGGGVEIHSDSDATLGVLTPVMTSDELLRGRHVSSGNSEHHQSGFMAENRTQTGVISGDREEFIHEDDINYHSRAQSDEEWQKFLLNIKDRVGYEVYTRDGRQYFRFLGQFEVAKDGAEFVRFNEGSKFPLLDDSDRQIYSLGGKSTNQVVSMVGEIVRAADGRFYCRLKGKKFPLTYSRTDETQWSREWHDRKTFDDGEVKTYHRASHGETVTSSRRIETHEERVRRGVYGMHEDEDVVDLDASREEPGLADGVVKILPPCEAARCVSLKCTLGRLEKDEEVFISARYRVKAATLKKISAEEGLKVSTQIVAKITKLPFIGKPAGDIVKNHEVFTNVQPTIHHPPESDVVPLWVVVLSACAGTIILLLLIFLLYKCGFFNRTRPNDGPEAQPLNRNGHYQGDEHM